LAFAAGVLGRPRFRCLVQIGVQIVGGDAERLRRAWAGAEQAVAASRQADRRDNIFEFIAGVDSIGGRASQSATDCGAGILFAKAEPLANLWPWSKLPAVNRRCIVAVNEPKRRPQLHDKQSERDDRELRIDKVGVRGLRFPIQVRDKAHSVQNTRGDHRLVRGFAQGTSRART